MMSTALIGAVLLLCGEIATTWGQGSKAAELCTGWCIGYETHSIKYSLLLHLSLFVQVYLCVFLVLRLLLLEYF